MTDSSMGMIRRRSLAWLVFACGLNGAFAHAQGAPPAPSTVAAPSAQASPGEPLAAAPVAETKTAGEAPAEPAEETAGDPWGDGPGGVSTGLLSFRALLQTRYTHTFASPSTNPRPGYALREDILARSGDGFSLDRFYLRIGAAPNEHLDFRAILDFAQLVSGSVAGTVKQAFGTLRPTPKHLETRAGIFKLPFSIMELDPIATYELARLGPTHDLIKDLGFGGRDVGADVMIAPLRNAKLLRLWLGAFRGHAHDERASPLGAIGGRVQSKPSKSLRLGADVVDLPYSPTYLRPFDTSNRDVLPMPDPLYPRARHWASGQAYSADVTFARYKLMVRVEGMLGTRVDIDTRYGAKSFMALWGLIAYRFRARPVRLMPALRADWLDADREHRVGVRRALSAGVTCFFDKRARLLLDVTRTDVEPGSPVLSQPLPLPAYPYFELSATRLVAQLQLEI